MSRACIVCILLCGFTTIAGEPTAPEAMVDDGADAKPPPPDAARLPVNVTPIIADLREVNVKLQTACRMEYGDTQCGMLRRADMQREQ